MSKSSLGVVIILKFSDNYFLIEQNKMPYKNFWGPVHGKVKSSETEEEAVVRETQEEIGLVVSPVKKLWVSKADYGVMKLHWWLARVLDGTIKVDSVEVSNYGYFGLEELFKKRLFPQTREFFLNMKG